MFTTEDERAFLEQELRSNPPHIRRLFILFMMLYAFFAVADLTYYPDDWQVLFVIRFAIVIPLLFLVILLTYRTSLSKLHQHYIALSFIVSGAGIAYMLILHPENIVYYGGLFMIYFSGYLLIRLRFRYAAFSGLAVLLFHLTGHILINQAFSETFLYGFMFFIGANLIGMTGAYMFEMNNRKQFLYDRTLSRKNDELSRHYEEKDEQYRQLVQSIEENRELIAKNEELKRLSQSLKESEERFKVLHNASFGGIALHDQGRILECNQGLAEITGYAMDELIGMDGLLLIAPDDRNHVMNHIKRGYEKPYEVQGLKKNGETYPVRLEARNMPYNDQNVRVVEFRDMTELVETQEQLKNTMEQHELVLNSTSSGIYVVDLNDVCRYVGENTLKLLGYEDKNDMLNRNVHALVHHSHEDGSPYPAKDCVLLRTLKSQKIINKEDIIWRKDGTFFPVSYSSAPLIEDGKVTGSVVTFFDISRIKQYEKELIESNIRFKTLFEKAPLGYQSLDIDGCFREVNETWLTVLGYRREDVLGKWFGDFLPPEDRKAFKERFERFKKLGKIRSEFAMIKGDGDRVSIEFEGLVGYDEQGTFKQTYCTLNDITLRKKLERERQQKERELKESEEQYRLLTSEMQLGLSLNEIICDDDGNPIDSQIVSVNKRWEKITGINRDLVLGKCMTEIFPNTEKEWIDVSGRVALTGIPASYESFAVDLNKYLSMSVYSPKKGQFAAVIDDVTEKREYEKSLSHTLKHDALTGLPNRAYYLEKIKESDRKNDCPLTIIMVDINGLKLINDSFGSKVGDQAIRQVSNLLSEGLREGDFLARHSGDEFLMICPMTSAEDAEAIKRQLIERAASLEIENIEYSLAIGYAVKETSEDDIDDVLRDAENAMYKNKVIYGQNTRSRAIMSVFATLTSKYAEEHEHSERVSMYCRLIGEHLDLKDDELDELELAGKLHDIGKISIPDAILKKPGKLTATEWKIMKEHTVNGYQILRAADDYSNLADYALTHHERWDGTGYPNGLSGEDIPLFSRIIGVADAYEAMTADRPYRKAMDPKEAVKELIQCAGSQFDERLVDIFVHKVLTSITEDLVTTDSN
jgi:diguanylate cyclase